MRDINAWTYSSFSYEENWSQVTLAPLIARTSWLWMGLLQLSLWSCQLLNCLDNSLTQFGSLCPVRGLVIKRFGIEQIFLFYCHKESFLKDLSLGNFFILIESS